MPKILLSPVNIPAAVLHLLDLEGESYGQRLLERIREITKNKVMARWGSVYPALSHLEQEGLVESTGVKAGETGRTRNMYRITLAGQQRAAENRDLVLRLFGKTA
jgi:DNA-binding PadR family transcriptional regulator